MRVPRNVFWFEILLYSALALDALSLMFANDLVITTTVMAAAMILVQFYFVWTATQRRAGWPRWALAAVLALSVLSLVQVIGRGDIRADNMIEIVSCALTAAGLFFSFTGGAQSWFE
jgi:hypothetical protein